jgi:hypothetical protein
MSSFFCHEAMLSIVSRDQSSRCSHIVGEMKSTWIVQHGWTQLILNFPIRLIIWWAKSGTSSGRPAITADASQASLRTGFSLLFSTK